MTLNIETLPQQDQDMLMARRDVVATDESMDAVASMLAAQKLYPDALVVFPGSQEKNLRNFFIKSMVYLFNMEDMKHIDFSRIKKLILVDTRQPGRIGKFSTILKRQDVEIHIYDHHPELATDIKAHKSVNRLTGATVTILTDILKEEHIDISPDEATIMCLGIYEDTGSFTFPSTTEQDFAAAAFLCRLEPRGPRSHRWPNASPQARPEHPFLAARRCRAQGDEGTGTC